LEAILKLPLKKVLLDYGLKGSRKVIDAYDTILLGR
jgi:hypothetical protein